MKKEAGFRSLSEDLPKQIIDQSAETILELCNATGRSEYWMRQRVIENVKAGKWEAVWKRIGKRLAPAYRRLVKRRGR